VSEKIKALGDNVVLEIIEQEKTKAGIYLPEKQRTNQRDAIIGKVIDAGPGRISEYGAKMEAGVKVGDYVLLPRSAGVEVEISAEGRGAKALKLRIIRGIELLGYVEESHIIQLGLVTT
jgi:co-chaperonin GroES (HSP10)